MKFVRICLFVLAAGLFFTSCEKDMSFEAGNAAGVLTDDGSGDCLPVTINGNYKVDTTLTAANSIDIQVNFSQEGVYDIRTDTVNGYSFRAIGSVPASGLATIHMVGSGTPAAAGTGVDIFHIVYGLSTCEVSIVLGGTTAPTAVYTFGNTAGVCTGATPAGTYTSGVAMDPATNTVTVQVTVTTAGTYNITTGSAVNGVIFSGTGTFTTGTTSVTLTASGTPPTSATPVNSTYTVADAAGTITGCTFMVTYAATPAAAPYTIDCTGAAVTGTYQIGTAMNSGNTVTIHATSTGAGFYTITATDGNVTFSGSGSFPGAVTNQAIILTATGTPAGAAGTVSFPAIAITSTTNSTCNFNVTYTAAAATGIYTATVNGVVTDFSTGANGHYDYGLGFPALEIDGFSATGQEMYLQIIYFTAGSTSVPAGAYDVNNASGSYDLLGDYTDALLNDYTAQTAQTPPSPTFTMTTNHAIVGGTASGTFQGAVKDGSGNIINITAGSFTNIPVN